MKRGYLILAILSVLALFSCKKEEYEFCFSKNGGGLDLEMEIDGPTLKIQSGNEISGPAQENADGDYYAHWGDVSKVDQVSALYMPRYRVLNVFVGENTTGRTRWFVVSGTHDGKEVSYTFKQKG